MYVTRPLSLYRKHPSALEEEPPEGPFTGYLVTTDEEAEADDTYCFGGCKRRRLKKLPFPQDKILNVVHSSEYRDSLAKKVWFLPVLDLPLSSNCYYVIRATGRFKGKAYICSGDVDMELCCFKKETKDRKPRPLDPRNINQKFKIHRHYGHSFFAKSLAPYGNPPKLLRDKGWEVKSSRLSRYNFQNNDALGLDPLLRTQLPSFSFPISRKNSPRAVVGTWYCPFVFVREGNARVGEQMRKSILYKMTLEQHWEQVYSCENVNDDENNAVVIMDVSVKREVDYVYGREGKKDRKINESGFVWYRGERGASVGLSFAIVEKMKMVEEEGGWVDDVNRRYERIERRIDIRSESGWRRLSCFVLVESFVLRRMDGTLVLHCDFRHTHQLKCKCE